MSTINQNEPRSLPAWLNAQSNYRQSKRCHTLLLCIVLAFGLSSCGNGNSALGVEQGLVDDDAGGAAVSNNAESSGDCTYALNSDITSPTTLVNTAAACDYLLEEWVEVRSLLVIEPGTVIRSKANERFLFDGGELRAVGTAEQRIVFEGVASVEGYWRGIDVDSARNIVMDYVDIRDAGQVCSIMFCPDVGVYIEDSPLSFTNSSVSNSYVHGMSIASGVRIDAFSNNRFYGNELTGLSINIESVPGLDVESDYYGLDGANGIPYVGVISGDQESGEIFRWKALNVPYRISGYLHVYGGIMQLEPGVELVFGSEAWMTVEGNGVLKSLGTATDPVIIRGFRAQAGYWDGITLSDTNFDTSILQHTTISHSGNTDSLVNAYAAVRLEGSYLTLKNATFSDNARWAIICEEPSGVTDASTLVDEGGNLFSNNGNGITDDCIVR